MNKENQKEINEVFDLIEKQCVGKEFKELIKEIKELVNENIEKQYKLDKIKEKVKYYRSAKYGTYDSDDILADLSYILLEEIE